MPAFSHDPICVGVDPHCGKGAVGLLERLRGSIHTNREEIHSTVRVTASFGAANTGKRSGITAEILMHEADRALYRAKKDGRDRVRVFSTEDETVVAQMA